MREFNVRRYVRAAAAAAAAGLLFGALSLFLAVRDGASVVLWFCIGSGCLVVIMSCVVVIVRAVKRCE